MRRIAFLLALAGLALGPAGCGDRNMILTVNLLSFIAPADRAGGYGPVPAGLAATNVDLVNQDVTLLPGLSSSVDVESASLRIGMRFENQTGSASGHVLVYLAPPDAASPFSVPPLADIPVTLAPNDTVRVATEIASSPALAAAFTQEHARLGVRVSFDTTGSLSVLQGTETTEELLGIVVTKRSL